jgi:hypothetical protein
MRDRRDHHRFALGAPWKGTLRVLRDVLVQHGNANEMVVIGNSPSVVGEVMTLEVVGGGASVSLDVRVLETRPVLVAGMLRHQVRLAVLDEETPRFHSPDDARDPAGCEAP